MVKLLVIDNLQKIAALQNDLILKILFTSFILFGFIRDGIDSSLTLYFLIFVIYILNILYMTQINVDYETGGNDVKKLMIFSNLPVNREDFIKSRYILSFIYATFNTFLFTLILLARLKDNNIIPLDFYTFIFMILLFNIFDLSLTIAFCDIFGPYSFPFFILFTYIFKYNFINICFNMIKYNFNLIFLIIAFIIGCIYLFYKSSLAVFSKIDF